MSAILVVGPSWVGDMVMAQSLFSAIKQRDPHTEIDVLAPAWSVALLHRMKEVRAAIEMPVGHGEVKLRTRYQIGASLRNQYTQAIVLPGSLKSALIPWCANIPQRTGYLGELRWGLLNDVRRLDKEKLPQTVQRFVALGQNNSDALPKDLPRPQLDIVAGDVDQSLERLHLHRTGEPILALCPGAEHGSAKRWPVDSFTRVAEAQRDKGWKIWIFGSAKDAGQGRTIAQRVGADCIDLTGKTSMDDAVNLMSLAQVVLSNDSGLMHVAAALNKNLVALFGSSDPTATPPMHVDAKIMHLNLECSPCFAKECPLGHRNCLRNISPQSVLDAVRGFSV